MWLSTSSFIAALDAVRNVTHHLITFDDGNRSDLEIAAPRLAERGMTAIFFICAGRLNDDAYLAASDARQLLDAGMSIGSHGMDHIRWRGLDPERLEAELVTSKSILEDALGIAIHDAACPFGMYDRTVLKAVRRAGYRRLFTSDGVGPRMRGWIYPRTTITATNANADAISRLRAASGLRRLSCAARIWIKSCR